MTNIERTDDINSSAPVPTRIVDEINQSRIHQPCANAINSGHDLLGFGRGTVVGAIEGADSFIEFMAKPYAVNEALIGIGPMLDNAVDYYGDKLSHRKTREIARDVSAVANYTGEWLAQYSKKPPEVRGKICGRFAADVLLIEAGTSIARGALAATEPAFGTPILESRSATFDQFVGNLETTEGVGFKQIRRFDASRPFAEHVDQILEKAPERVREFLKRNGIEVIPVSNLDALGADFRNALGLYAPDRRVIFIAEEPHVTWVEAGFGSAERTKLTVSHEVGHAVDHCAKPNHWLSSSRELQRSFDADFAVMSKEYQEASLRDFGQGSMDRLRKEMFAELFSHSAVPTADPLIRNFVFGNFPRMYKTMGEMEECIVRTLRPQK